MLVNLRTKPGVGRRLKLWGWFLFVVLLIVGISKYTKDREMYHPEPSPPKEASFNQRNWLGGTLNSKFELTSNQIDQCVKAGWRGDCDSIQKLSQYYTFCGNNALAGQFWMIYGADLNCVLMQYAEILRCLDEINTTATKYWINKFENNKTSSSASYGVRFDIEKIRRSLPKGS